MRWLRWCVCFASLICFGVTVTPTSALADVAVEQFIKSRQANTRDLGGGFNEIKKELAKGKPMQFLLEQYASQMEALALDQAKWFPAGTGPDSGYPTQAKANIWTERAEFDAMYVKSRDETLKLAQIAPTKDYKAMEAQLEVLKGACLACHDRYKEKGEHDFQF